MAYLPYSDNLDSRFLFKQPETELAGQWYNPGYANIFGTAASDAIEPANDTAKSVPLGAPAGSTPEAAPLPTGPYGGLIDLIKSQNRINAEQNTPEALRERARVYGEIMAENQARAQQYGLESLRETAKVMIPLEREKIAAAAQAMAYEKSTEGLGDLANVYRHFPLASAGSGKRYFSPSLPIFR